METARSLRRKVSSFVLDVSILIKIMGMVAVVVVVSGAAAVICTRLVIAEAVGRQLDVKAKCISRELAIRSRDSVLTDDIFNLHELARDTMRADGDVRYVLVLGQQGEVLADTFHNGVPGDLLKLDRKVSGGVRLTRLSSEEGIIHNADAPITAADALVRVGLTQSSLNQGLAASTNTLVLAIAIASVAAFLLAYLLVRLLSRPFSDLEEAARALGDGHLQSRARVWCTDEIGYLAITFNEMADKLEESYAEILRKEEARGELLRKLISSQEEERRRIARELHDETSQALAAINVALGTLGGANDPAERIDCARTIVNRTLERVKGLTTELRPGLLDELGLVAAISQYAATFEERYGLPVSFEAIGIDGQRFASEIETTIYRIVQEALVNAAKHSGASQASVVMLGQLDSLRVLVEDDGCGFDIGEMCAFAAGRSLGVYGMHERANLTGGALRVDSTPGEGTTITLDVPLQSRGKELDED